MGLETGTHIDDFVRTNPLGADDRSTADDHLRLIKDLILNTFPNLTGAMNATQVELNLLVGLLAAAAELNILDGATLSTAELNILAGAALSTVELNILAGATLSTAEINFVDGVTSLIQTQLNGKAPTTHNHTAAQTNSGEFLLARIPTIDQAKLGSAAVGQAELKTTTSEVSTNNTTGVNLTLAGGDYGFYPRSHTTIGGSTNNESKIQVQISSNSYVTTIWMKADNSSRAMFARQRYIQASPPYDLGDGEIPLFIFVEVEDITGNILSTYVAPEAPWHYNGPTSIRVDGISGDGKPFKLIANPDEINAAMVAAGHPPGLTKAAAKSRSPQAFSDYISAVAEADTIEIEITQAIKQADMSLIPRPMEPHRASGPDNPDDIRSTVIMLDPVAPLTLMLFEVTERGEFSVSELLHDGDLIIDNTPLVRFGPPGVDVVNYRFK